MSDLVANCPRCRSTKITFDLLSQVIRGRNNWQNIYEAFCVCRACNKPTIFILKQREVASKEFLSQYKLNELPMAANQVLLVDGYVSLKDESAIKPPEHLPDSIEKAFKEGAICHSVGCFNAAATMFRLCIDLATKDLLPDKDINGLTKYIRRNLGLRLVWLFDNNFLPEALRELSYCIKEEGNDGAHDGSLEIEDSEDIQDFSFFLLERLFTEPKRIQLANQRREQRRRQS